MRIETSPYGLRSNRNARLIWTTVVTAVLLLMAASVAHAPSQTAGFQPQISKSPVIAIKMGPDQIAVQGCPHRAFPQPGWGEDASS